MSANGHFGTSGRVGEATKSANQASKKRSIRGHARAPQSAAEPKPASSLRATFDSRESSGKSNQHKADSRIAKSVLQFVAIAPKVVLVEPRTADPSLLHSTNAVSALLRAPQIRSWREEEWELITDH